MGGGWQSHQNDDGMSGGGRYHGHDDDFPGASFSGDSMGDSWSGMGNNSSSGSDGSDGSNGGGFRGWVQQLLIKKLTEHRRSIMITSAFSIAASALVIGVILYDARSFQRSRVMLHNGKMKTKNSIWTSLHSAEVFALAVAVAAVIQSVVFIGVQSTTLDSQWATGCDLTAQLVWPASWLVAAMILVLSLEIMFRSVRKPRFKPRGRWTVLGCVAIVILFMLALWLVAFLSKTVDSCWGSLLWWTLHYGRPALALTAGTMFTNLVTAIILVVQLVKTIQMDKSERIAASRVVYSLGMNFVILAFILPFWITVVAEDISRTASEIADIMVSLNGLLQGVLHLLLRVNSDTLAIRPKATPWTEKRKIRLFGPNDVNIHEYISSPLLLERDSTGARWSRAIKEKDLQKLDLSRPPPMPSTPITPQQPITILPARKSSLPPSTPKVAGPTARRPSNTHYSLFPTEASTRAPIESWITEFSTDSDEVEPPPPLFIRRHGRNDSTQTSETVEFALRISNAAPDLLSPIAPTPLEPVIHSPVTNEEGVLSPTRYMPPQTPGSPAVRSDIEVESAQATSIVFERPRAPAELKSQKPRRTMSLRNSFARLGQQRRRDVDKSLPPLPRDSVLDRVVVKREASTRVPDWRESSKEHKPQYATQQQVTLHSPIEESHPPLVPPEWI